MGGDIGQVPPKARNKPLHPAGRKQNNVMHRSGQRRVLPMVNQRRLPGELGRSAPAPGATGCLSASACGRPLFVAQSHAHWLTSSQWHPVQYTVVSRPTSPPSEGFQSMTMVRWSRVSWLGLLAATTVAGTLLFRNVRGYTPNVVGGLSRDRPYNHGWPFTYLVRNDHINTSSGCIINHIPWPWANIPGVIREFSLPLLVCDGVVALVIAVATYLTVARLATQSRGNSQYSLRTLFLVVSFAALVMAFSRFASVRGLFRELVVPVIIWCGVACVVFQPVRWAYVRWPGREAD